MQRIFYKNSSALRSCVWTFVLIMALIFAVGYCTNWGTVFASVSIAAVFLYSLYMALLSKRFFTKVKFDDDGIALIFGKKVREHYMWTDIARVSRGVECRKPCYVLYDKEGKVLLILEKRSEIGDILKKYLKE